jgi:hypothetical protein
MPAMEIPVTTTPLPKSDNVKIDLPPGLSNSQSIVARDDLPL